MPWVTIHGYHVFIGEGGVQTPASQRADSAMAGTKDNPIEKDFQEGGSLSAGEKRYLSDAAKKLTAQERQALGEWTQATSVLREADAKGVPDPTVRKINSALDKISRPFAS